jgi:hypothetical protein
MWLDLVERVVEGEVQNVKRSSFLTKYRPKHCSHNPPRAPTAPTHPKPTRTHHICRHARKGLYPAIPSFELWNSRCGIFCGQRVKRWPIGYVRSGDLSATVPLFTTVAGGGDSVGQLIYCSQAILRVVPLFCSRQFFPTSGPFCAFLFMIYSSNNKIGLLHEPVSREGRYASGAKIRRAAFNSISL